MAAKPDIGLLIGVGPKPKKPGADAEMGGDIGAESSGMDEGKSMACAALRSALQGDDDEALFSAFKELLAYADEDDAGSDEEVPEEMPDLGMEA